MGFFEAQRDVQEPDAFGADALTPFGLVDDLVRDHLMEVLEEALLDLRRRPKVREKQGCWLITAAALRPPPLSAASEPHSSSSPR